MKLPPRLNKFEVGQVFRQGKSEALHHFRIVWREEMKETKVSYLSPTKLGNAVVRNRVRRKIREAFIATNLKLIKGTYLAILPRPSILNATIQELTSNLKKLLSKTFRLHQNSQE